MARVKSSSGSRYQAVVSAKAHRAGQLLRHTSDSKRWQVRAFIGRDASGKRIYTSEVVHGTKRDAEARLLDLLRQKTDGNLTPRSRMTLCELVREWEEHKRRDVSPRTLAGYMSALERYVLPSLGHRKISEISLREIDLLYGRMLNGEHAGRERAGNAGSRPLSARTVRLTHAALSQALSQAVKWGLIRFNPATGATLRTKQSKERAFLTVPERSRFIESCSESFYGSFYRLLVDTGLRPGEACALRWEDLDFGRGTISVQRTVTRDGHGGALISAPKTAKSRRTVPMVTGLKEDLLQHLERQRYNGLDASGFVFTNTRGCMLRPWSFSTRDLRRTARSAGITKTVSLYTLRHTFATLHVAAGTHIKVVSDVLGHSTIQQTANTYMHGDIGVTADAMHAFERAIASLEDAARQRVPN